MWQHIKRSLSRAKYAATGGAISGAAGAVFGEKWSSAEPAIKDVTDKAKPKASDLRS
jgi:hypothetical protein